MNSKLTISRRIVILLLVVALLLCVGGYYYSQRRNDQSAFRIPANPSGATINYGPATAQEKKDATAHKDDLVTTKDAQSKANNTTVPGSKKIVTPVITSAIYQNSVAEVRAFVPGIYENDGICKLKLAQNTQIITRETPAAGNATTTDCQSFTLNRSDFPSSGTWSIVMSYASATSEGASSQNSNIEVP